MIDLRPDLRRALRWHRLHLNGGFRTRVICGVLRHERRMNRRYRWKPTFVRERYALRCRIRSALLDVTDPEDRWIDPDDEELEPGWVERATLRRRR